MAQETPQTSHGMRGMMLRHDKQNSLVSNSGVRTKQTARRFIRASDEKSYDDISPNLR